MDTAIGQFKRNTRRLQELGKGKNWLELIGKATKAFNASHHGATGAPPDNLPDSVILEQRKLAAEAAGYNDRATRARKAKLEKLGGFRTLNPKKRGMKKRADEATWGSRIHVVSSFPTAAVVEDEDGSETATKRVLAVPLDSSAVADAPTTLVDRLGPYAEELRNIVSDGPATFARSAETLWATMPGLENVLRNANLTTTAFTAMFPDLLVRQGRSISAV